MKPMSRTRIIAVALVVAAALAAMNDASHAYGTNASWPSMPVTFYANPQNADVSADAAEAALKAGMDAWNEQSGSAFRYVYGGRTNDTTNGYDSRNVIVFRNASNGSALATTYSWWSGSSMVDADVVFWDGGFTFFTGTAGCSGGAYVEDIAAHELGHALGLQHSTFSDATMYPTYSWCSQEMRSLAPDDKAGAQALYPVSPSSPPPPSNTAPSLSISSPANGSSYAQGTAVTFNAAASDSQDGTLTAAISWSSNIDGAIGSGSGFSRTLSAGSHTITARVTDSGGLSTSRQVSVTVDPPVAQGGPSLSARGYKVRGSAKADLVWSGFSSSSVDVYRNGVKVITTPNDGSETDAINKKGGGTYTYQACEGAGTACSNRATVTF